MVLKKICLLALCVSTFFIAAMDGPQKHTCDKECYEAVRDAIDGKILGISEDAWFRRTRATLASTFEYAQTFGDRSQVMERMSEVNSVIPFACHNDDMFKKLYTEHWYTAFLMPDVVGKRTEQFEHVTGSTLAGLLCENVRINSDLSLAMNLFIHRKAIELCTNQMCLSSALIKMQFNSADCDIHFLPLNDAAEVGSGVCISLKGNYVRAVRKNTEEVFWQLDNGKKCDLVQKIAGDERVCWQDQYVEVGDYLVVLGIVQLPGINDILRRLYSRDGYQGIVIFKRPTFISWLCQRAFKNSWDRQDMLTNLLRFVAETKLIDSFTKTNLENKIVRRLEDLAKTE